MAAALLLASWLVFAPTVTASGLAAANAAPAAAALQAVAEPAADSERTAESSLEAEARREAKTDAREDADAAAELAKVEQVREALGGMGYAPWYDADKDELKRVNVQPPRKWLWLEKIRDFFQGLEGPDWNLSWVGTMFEGLGVFAQILIYFVLLALLFGLAYLFVRIFAKLRDRRRGEDDEDELEDELLQRARVEELPMQLSAPRGDFLAEARRRYEAGDYSGAIIYLFSHELLQLDRHQRIQLERGKTNRQYLREVRNEPFLANALSRTMVAFEDVFFGHHALDRTRFEACWREVDEFHRRLPTGAAQ